MTTARRFHAFALTALVAACAWGSPQGAHAAVIVHGTRVIYPAQEREVTVRVENTGDLELLVQSWLDEGDSQASPDQADVPFHLGPAVFRLKPNAQQSLRIIKTGGDLPTAQEKLYWLNVLEVPPKSNDGEARNKLHVTLRTRLKLIYRPASLKPEGARRAPAALRWSLVRNPNGAGMALQAINPTPYYVHLAQLQLKQGTRSFKHPDIAVAAPNTTTVFALPTATATQPGGEVHLVYLTDNGAERPHTAPLASP